MNKILLKVIGLASVVVIVFLGYLITKNYMINPVKNAALVPSVTINPYTVGCMDFKACNYNSNAKKKGDCNYATYVDSSEEPRTTDVNFLNLGLMPARKPNPNKGCPGEDCDTKLFLKKWTVKSDSSVTKPEVSQIGTFSDTFVTNILGTNACKSII